MASKKKKKQRNRQRQATSTWSSSTPPAETEAGVTSSPTPVSTAAATAAPAAKPAYATGITGPRKATQGGAAATGVIDIDARVPYFSSDLRRVVVTALVMIVLIVAGSLLIK